MNQARVGRRVVVACLGLMPLGCSLYQPRPVTFTVRDAETKQPIAGATVRTDYMTMLDFGVLLGSVGPTTGETDREGKLTLIVDPHHSRFDARIEAMNYIGTSGNRGYSMKFLPRRWYLWTEECQVTLYRTQAPSAELVLPKGYRGPVVVYFPPTDVPPANVGQRHFTYAVSDRGGVEIPQAGLFENSMDDTSVQARYTDARSPLPTVHTHQPEEYIGQRNSDQVALRFVDSDPETQARIYVVGTPAEFGAARKQVRPGYKADKAAIARILAEHPRPVAGPPAR